MLPRAMVTIPKNIFEGKIMFGIYWTNFGYKSDEEFDTMKGALDYGKSKGFEFTVLDANGATAAYFTTFGGVHYAPGVEPLRA